MMVAYRECYVMIFSLRDSIWLHVNDVSLTKDIKRREWSTRVIPDILPECFVNNLISIRSINGREGGYWLPKAYLIDKAETKQNKNKITKHHLSEFPLTSLLIKSFLYVSCPFDYFKVYRLLKIVFMYFRELVSFLCVFFDHKFTYWSLLNVVCVLMAFLSRLFPSFLPCSLLFTFIPCYCLYESIYIC